MKTRLKHALTFALVATGVSLALSACNLPDPCAGLPVPTPQDIAVAQNGREVEIELESGTDCELNIVTKTWAVETSG